MLLIKAGFFWLEPRVFMERKKEWVLEEKEEFVFWTPRHVEIVPTSHSAGGYLQYSPPIYIVSALSS